MMSATDHKTERQAKEKKQTKTRIMVLDDEKPILALFSSYAARYHYEADVYMDSLAALETVKKDPDRYRLIITDIRMPKMDGVTFAKKVRALSPKLPIVIMTGYPSEELRKEVLRLGNTLFLEKPLQMIKVFEAVIPKLLHGKEDLFM